MPEPTTPEWRFAPAAEVRRRGDRLTRRRRLAAWTAGTVAVVAVAAPAAVAGTRALEKPAAPIAAPPAPSPSQPVGSVAWRRTVPAGFDLAAGIDRPVETRTPEYWIAGCEEDTLVGGVLGRPSDATAIGTPGGSGVDVMRTLFVYPTASQARSALGGIRTTLSGCASSNPRLQEVQLSMPLGEESVAYANRDVRNSTATLREVTVAALVGNAVVVDRTTFGANAVGVDRGAVQEATGTRAIVDQLCVFAAHPC